MGEQQSRPETQSNKNGTEWKVLVGQVIIGILGAIQIIRSGDGTILASVIAAESTLAGVQIVLSKS